MRSTGVVRTSAKLPCGRTSRNQLGGKRRAISFREAARWTAASVAIAIEGALVWLIDRLPTWAQIVVYGLPTALLIAGIAVLLRARFRTKRPAA